MGKTREVTPIAVVRPDVRGPESAAQLYRHLFGDAELHLRPAEARLVAAQMEGRYAGTTPCFEAVATIACRTSGGHLRKRPNVPQFLRRLAYVGRGHDVPGRSGRGTKRPEPTPSRGSASESLHTPTTPRPPSFFRTAP